MNVWGGWYVARPGACEEMKAAFGPAGLQLSFDKVFKLSIAMNLYSQLFRAKGLGRCGMA